jgi:hypothetical protein
MDGLARETVIVAKASEEVTMIAMTTAAWRAGSVLILNANFMPRCCGKGQNYVKKCKECAGEGHSCKRREPGTMQQRKVAAMTSSWFLGVVKNLVMRK